jgi:acylglycerol lipase
MAATIAAPCGGVKLHAAPVARYSARMKEETLKVNDRLSVFLATWAPEGAPRGVVALVHGLGEHSGRYRFVADFLTNRGFLVLAPDAPGHGRNPGIRGHASYALWDAVVAALVAEARRRGPRGSPVFLYGHSTGGNRVLWWQITNPQERIAGIVASSPSLGAPDPKPSRAKKVLAAVLSRLAPAATMENGLDLTNLSRDPAAVEEIVRDPLFHTKLSALMGMGFLESWAWFARWRGGAFTSPVLILQGTADRCVDPKATIAVAGKITGDVTLKTWDGFCHVLHADPQKLEVLAYIAGWMDRHAS